MKELVDPLDRQRLQGAIEEGKVIDKKLNYLLVSVFIAAEDIEDI